MLAEIKNIEDVAVFTMQLVDEGLNLHPDEDFDNYISIITGEPTYTRPEAELRNRLMEKCFEVCAQSGIDIYSYMQEIILVATGMDKFIPLPSAIL